MNEHTETKALDSPQLLRPREIAAILGVSRAYAYRLIYNGTLPAIHIGKSLRVDAQEVTRLIELGKVTKR